MRKKFDHGLDGASIPRVQESASGNVGTLIFSDDVLEASAVSIIGSSAAAAGADVLLYERLGTEFRVNTTMVSDQVDPAVTKLAGGGFVVVWTSYNQDGSGTGIYAQRYSANGTPMGTEFLINSTTAGNQSWPSIAELSGGGFIATWTGQDTSGYGIYAQSYSASGVRVGSEFRVNMTTADNQYFSAVTALSAGGYVVSWQSNLQDGSGHGIYLQRYTAAGTAVGGEVRVNTAVANNQLGASITGLSDGGFVVTWNSSLQDGSGSGIYAQRYNSAGTAVGAEFRVNVSTADDQQSPSVTALPSGGFVVSWMSYLQDGSGAGIYLRQYAADGTSVGGDVRVNTTVANEQTTPTVAAHADGGYTIAWMSQVQDGGNEGIYAQRYAANGTTIGSEFLVNSNSTFRQFDPAIAILSDGTVAVAWESLNQDGNFSGIYGQLFKSDLDGITDVDLSALTLSEISVENLAVATLTNNGSVNGHVDYVLLSDSTGGAFRIEGDQLVVDDSALLDAENAPNVTITVRATDANGNSFDQLLTLSVTNSASESRLLAGDEFVVGGTEGQAAASVASFADGSFIMAWHTYSVDGGNDVFAQRFGADGTKVGSEFPVNTETADSQEQPSVIVLADGGFVVSWASSLQDGGEYGIYAQRYASDGNTVGAEFRVNTTVMGTQEEPALTALADGGFVATWVSSPSGSLRDIYGQRYGADGEPLGGEFKISMSAVNTKIAPSVQALADGGFLVTWNTYQQDGSGYGVYAQRFDLNGQATGIEFRVNTTVADHQLFPSATALADGGFVVSWGSNVQDGSGSGIYLQRYAADGSLIGGEVRVNTTTASDQSAPSVTALPDGGLLVAWMSQFQDGSDWGIYAQRYAADGTALGGEFRLNATTTGAQLYPTLTTLAGGGLLASWTSYDLNYTSSEIHARLFSVTNSDLARHDAFATSEAAPITGDVLQDNGLGPDIDQLGTPQVVALNGVSSALGQQTTLASGALLTLNADGTFHYDPNGKFDSLTDTSSGATNTSATESFSYTLSGGATATVVITINGVVSFGDQLRGNTDDNTITGRPGGDTFYLQDGGDDIAHGLSGNDILYYGAALTANDQNNGGSGTDTLVVQGDYSLTLGAGSTVGIEGISLQSGSLTRWGDTGDKLYDYSLTTVDANVSAGQQFRVNAQSLLPGEDFSFDGEAETNGSFLIYGGFGTDQLVGGANNDIFYFEAGRLGGGDKVNGGGGADALVISGGTTGSPNLLTFAIGGGQLTGIEAISFNGRFASDPSAAPSYSVVLAAGNVAGGASLTINGSSLGAAQSLSFDGSAELQGRFSMFGGAGADTLTAGANADLIYAASGADTLTGGGGADNFQYRAVGDSTASAPDQILDFLSGTDKLDLSQIDANIGLVGPDAFEFIGSAAFGNRAGELRAVFDAGTSVWSVQGDVNGDGVADLQILVNSSQLFVSDLFL